jgi:hypothetical protein
LEQPWKSIRRGWYLGDSDFNERLLERTDEVLTGKKRTSLTGRAIKEVGYPDLSGLSF